MVGYGENHETVNISNLVSYEAYTDEVFTLRCNCVSSERIFLAISLLLCCLLASVCYLSTALWRQSKNELRGNETKRIEKNANFVCGRIHEFG